MKENLQIMYLLKIALEHEIFSEISISTIKLSKKLDLSQQSTSRILEQLNKSGYIIKKSNSKGITIKITKKGLEKIKKIKEKFEKKFNFKNITFKGKIKQGLGEGKYYITRPEYMKQFKEKLDITPYPGTLNVEVDEQTIDKIQTLIKPIKISGFKTKQRTFSPIDCYKCKLENKFKGYILLIERTSHPKKIIEIISEYYLRKRIKKETKIQIKANEVETI